MKPLFKILKKILLVAGLGVFGYLVWKLGWENVVQSLVLIGWWWIPILLLSIAWQFCHTMAWHQILRSLGHRPSPLKLLKLKFVAEAINMVAPSANLGGDMARAYLVKKEVPLTAGISSVMVDKTLDNFNRMFFNIIGLSLTAFFIPVPQKWVWACILLFTLVFLFNSLLVLVQVKGFSKSVANLARFVPPLRRSLEQQEEKLHAMAADLHAVYLKNPLRIIAATCWHLSGRLLGMMEIWLVLFLLGTPTDFIGTYYIAAVASIINGAFFLVPGQWGVAEGTQIVLLQSLGYTAAAGLSLGIIRRIRKLILTGIGLAIFWLYKKEPPEVVMEPSPTLAEETPEPVY